MHIVELLPFKQYSQDESHDISRQDLRSSTSNIGWGSLWIDISCPVLQAKIQVPVVESTNPLFQRVQTELDVHWVQFPGQAKFYKISYYTWSCCGAA